METNQTVFISSFVQYVLNKFVSETKAIPSLKILTSSNVVV